MDSADRSGFFEIPIRDDVPNSPRAPLTPRAIASPNRSLCNESDLVEKLERASQRRSSVLEETRNKNERRVQMAKEKCQKEKVKVVLRSHELLDNLEDDLAQKALRRQQILEEKVNSAKKELEKAKQLADARSNSRELLLRQIDDDLSNKENNRRSFLQSIVQQCQLEAEKVDQVRSRRSMNNSSNN